MPEREPQPALRVRIRRRGDTWTILKQTRIPDMTLPAADELPETGGRALHGFWFEVRSARDEVLFRRVLRNPTEQAVEVPSAAGGLERVDVDRPEVVFDVLIPEHPERSEIHFFENEPRTGSPGTSLSRSRIPIARLSLGSAGDSRPRGRRRA